MGDQVKDKVAQAVEEKISGSDIFLVEVKVSPARISVAIDKPAGITLTECTEVARYLREKLNDTDIFEKHELEVSSPGMEEPLKVLNQYRKRIGREVRVLMANGLVKQGILKLADDEGL